MTWPYTKAGCSEKKCAAKIAASGSSTMPDRLIRKCTAITAYANINAPRIRQDMSQLRSLKQSFDEWEREHHTSMWSLMLQDVIDRAIEIEAESVKCQCSQCRDQNKIP